MCDPVGAASDTLADVGQGVSDAVSNVGNSIADVWHDVSSPVVDSNFGRAALTAAGAYFGGGPGAALVNAGLGASDLATGHGERTMGNFVRGLTGYYGAAPTDVAATGIDTGAVDLSGSGLEELTKMGAGPQVAMPTAGSFALPDVASTQAFTDLSPNIQAPEMVTQGGMQGGPLAPDMVTQGGMNPLPSVGQGAELAYNPPVPTEMSFDPNFNSPSLGDMFDTVDSFTKKYLGQGAVKTGMGLYDMYRKNQAADMLAKQGQQMGQQANSIQQNLSRIQDMYAPGSPEYEMLAQEIARKDAKAGRNSQYGQRAVELAARINALKQNQYAPGLSALTSLQNTGANLSAAGQALRTGSMNGLGTNWTLANLPK